MAFDRSPASDLWRHTLSQIPTTFGRLVFLSTLRDPNTGAYAHYGFAQRVGGETADATLRQSHSQCFSEWLAFSLEGSDPLSSVARWFILNSSRPPHFAQSRLGDP